MKRHPRVPGLKRLRGPGRRRGWFRCGRYEVRRTDAGPMGMVWVYWSGRESEMPRYVRTVADMLDVFS